MQPDISVVVPIYGVEKYLKQCVDSILNQTFKNMEVILVDDGSRDRCPQMVDEYAAQDARVVAIHQPNGGYGKAVNAGIARARGKYIGIIESDDWIFWKSTISVFRNRRKPAIRTGRSVPTSIRQPGALPCCLSLSFITATTPTTPIHRRRSEAAS